MAIRILLITPFRFYGYSKNIQLALENSGYCVTTMNDEYPVSDLGALLGYLDLEISRTLSMRGMSKALLNEGVEYDIALIIKGRGISVKSLEVLRQYSKRIIAYNFDSFGYHPQPLRWMNWVDNYYSFDFNDCEKYEISRIDLYSSFTRLSLKNERRYTLSAIVRNHSDRVQFIENILVKANDAVFVHIYEKSIFTWVFNFLRNPSSMWRLRKFISLQPLPFDEYQAVIGNSVATIDYAHPKQTGLTIRCWEALACGTKIISNNKRLEEHKDFPEDSFLIWDSRIGTQELTEFLGTPIYQKYRTAEHFIKELKF